MSRVVRMSDQAASDLESLAKSTGQSKQQVIELALKRYAHSQLMKKANEQYARLRQDPAASKDLDEEIAAWDTTLHDGSDDDGHD